MNEITSSRDVHALAALIADLTRHGCTVPHAEAFTAVCATAIPEPTSPSSVLHLSSHQVAAMAETIAHDRLLRVGRVPSGTLLPSVSSALIELKGRAATEMAGVLVEHTDELIMQLRQRFDPLADRARDVRARGVQPHATAEDILTTDKATIDAWTTFRSVHAPQLQVLADLRIRMSQLLHIPPYYDLPGYNPAGQRDVNYGPCFTSPPMTYADQNRNAPVHERWLRLAPNLHLTTVSDLSEVDWLRAAGVNTRGLQAEALRRAQAQAMMRDGDLVGGLHQLQADDPSEAAGAPQPGATLEPEREPAW